MSDSIKFVPPRVPFLDQRTGLISREWYLFFQGIFDRIGGSIAPSITDLSNSLFEDAGTSETNAMLFEAQQALSQNPPYEQYVNDVLLAELNGLRELVAEQAKELDALKQSPAM